MEVHKFPPPMEIIACFKRDKIEQHTDASIQERVALMAHLQDERRRRRLTKEGFENRSSMLGWNHNPAHEKLFGEKLNIKVASWLMWDWAHVYVHGGLCDVEVGKLNKKFASSKYTIYN